MPQLPLAMTNKLFVKAHEDATYRCVKQRIREVFNDNYESASVLRRRKKGRQADQLISNNSQLATAIGFARTNPYPQTAPIYKLLLIAWALEKKYNWFIDPTDIMTETLADLRANTKAEITNDEITDAISDFYEAPKNTVKIEKLLAILIGE